MTVPENGAGSVLVDSTSSRLTSTLTQHIISSQTVPGLPPATAATSSQHVANDASTMSAAGLSQLPSVGESQLGPWPARRSASGQDAAAEDAVVFPSLESATMREVTSPRDNPQATEAMHPGQQAPVQMRVHFEDFAAQLRLQRHHEHRKRMLYHRKQKLRKAVALSARLNRVGSFVHDGLVEIARHSDTTGFVHVQQHVKDLVDLCTSHWDNEMRERDSFDSLDLPHSARINGQTFLQKLSASSQHDCMDFIHTLRSKPRFMVERLKAMSPSQVATLSTSPRYSDLSDSVLTSLSQNRGRSSQRKRIKGFSKELEEYSLSFERPNPMSFMLFNVFGSPAEENALENLLRLSTWSSICADMLCESYESFQGLLPQVLRGFAALYRWGVKERMELYLMDVLQKGAFLLDMVDDQNNNKAFSSLPYDPLGTAEATAFFDDAIVRLFEILSFHEGGFPKGALQIGRAIIGRLPPPAQADFRGLFLNWFLYEYLRIAIDYPENEKILLRFHISENARVHILHQLWVRACSRAFQTGPPSATDAQVQFCVGALVSQLTPDDNCDDRYPVRRSLLNDLGAHTSAKDGAFLLVCAADIVHALEALNPQSTYFTSPWGEALMKSSRTTFDSQYAQASSKFHRLRREITIIAEPGSSAKPLHPCEEEWVSLTVGQDGIPVASVATHDTSVVVEKHIEHSLEPLDLAQEAAMQLLSLSQGEDSDEHIVHLLTHNSPGARLSALFEQQSRLAQARMNSTTALYWHQANTFLRRKYPRAILEDHDSTILKPLIARSLQSSVDCKKLCDQIDVQISVLENIYTDKRRLLSLSNTQLDELRAKLWYSANVIHSNVYEDALNVSRALNNMALPALSAFVSRPQTAAERPGTSTSSSSLFDQPRIDTLSRLKAPTEHGGPKKLADMQIELTKKWLDRNAIDNFCKGEERIHRFCMEVTMATKKLVGETLSESPVLWSSELFVREKAIFDVTLNTTLSAQASTRAPSVMSETLSSSVLQARPGLRSLDTGSKSLGSDMYAYPGRKTWFNSLGSGRISRELASELASSFGSPGRTTSTAESSNSIWSSLPSQSRSLTSVSWRSGPGSIFNDSTSLRIPDNALEKANFLEGLQRQLTCLLLSDLGCPVWSCGSETDGSMPTFRSAPAIDQRLQRRAVVADLLSPNSIKQLPDDSPTGAHADKSRRHSSPSERRREWPSDEVASKSRHQKLSALETLAEVQEPEDFSYKDAFLDLLDSISQQVDPFLKLKAVDDFQRLALSAALDQRDSPRPCSDGNDVGLLQPSLRLRRRSLDPNRVSQVVEDLAIATNNASLDHNGYSHTEDEIVGCIKEILLALKPPTIFRDLQYISAFVPSDTLNKTASGRAFLHLGLAALASKDDVCRSMIDVADKIIARDLIKRVVSETEESDQHVRKAAEYWMFAAREGNAIAQRELASLYLTHPREVPIVSLPLSLSSDTFRNEMMWEQYSGVKNRTQALCLALHWMQHAAENGDEIAIMKLKERKEIHSIRG